MSEATKSEAAAQTEIPGTAPAKVETAAEAKPARDYDAELKAAAQAAAKADKRAKDLEAKLADMGSVVEKIKGVFGGEKVEDPLAKVKELESRTSDYERKFKGALQRNALAESLVRAKVRPDLLDHALRLVDLDGVEFDLDAGRVKNADAVESAVLAFKEKFGGVYFQTDAPAPAAPGKPGIPASAMPPSPGQPASKPAQPDITPEMAMKLPLSELRAWRARQLGQKM